MEIIARAVGRRKEAVAQVQMIRGTGQFIINTKAAHEYLQNDSCAILAVQAPFELFRQNSTEVSNQTKETTLETVDTIVKVKGGGLKGQAEAIRLGIARALCLLDPTNSQSQPPGLTLSNSKPISSLSQQGLRKLLKDKGYLTQDSRVKERRKYGLKKARKASQYHKR